MADDNEVQVKFTADTSGLASARTAYRDIVGEQEAFEASAAKMAGTTSTASKGMGELKLATSGVSTELIRLGHEAVTGNFSRIPGSLLVLSSRMGGLSLATTGIIGAFAAAALGVAAFANAENNAANQTGSLNARLQATQKAITTAQLKDYQIVLSEIPGSTRDFAEQVTGAFLETQNVSATTFRSLAQDMQKYSAATGKDMGKAGEDLLKAFDDPAKGAIELNKEFAGLDQSLVSTVIRTQEANGAFAAQPALMKLLDSALENITPKYGALTNAWSRMKQSWDELFNDLSKPLPTGQGQDIAQAEKATEAQNQHTAALRQGMDIARELGTVNNQRAEIQGKLNQLLEAEKYASSAADKSQMQGAVQKLYQQQAELRDIDVNKEASALQSKMALDTQFYSGQAELVRSQTEQQELSENNGLSHFGDVSKNKIQIINTEYARLEALAEQQYEQEVQLYSKEAALYNKDSIEFQKVQQQKALAAQKFNTQILNLQNQQTTATQQAANKDESAWTNYTTSAQNSFNQSVTGYIYGTETMSQAAQKFVQMAIEGLIELGLKKAEQWALDTAISLFQGDTQAAGNIAASAAAAGAGAYAAIAAIPFVGPILAPAAAATAYAGAISYETLVGLDVGAWDLPNDGVYQLHAGESVVPKNFAQGMRESGGAGGSGGGLQTHFHINAMDSKDVGKFFSKHGSTIAHQMTKQFRNGNRGSRTSNVFR